MFVCNSRLPYLVEYFSTDFYELKRVETVECNYVVLFQRCLSSMEGNLPED